MKEITRKDVEYVSDLARIKLSEEETQDMVRQLTRIIQYIEKLNELDTSNVEPTAHILPLQNVMREDAVKPSLSIEEATDIAPNKNNDMFKVPRIIEG
jgi:aspartyl-tRNA(Asn)/glutamyl-tRNA(Gln) amidotransferase subunit C